jgi:prepilin-type N-terminal cleavage/methylation domain-containing protein/prepilin-type processing-associated H-X9-DG protein
MTPRSTARYAFTLIELLVVISIIALLIGILLPVLGSARDTAKQTICLSNQRQLGLATQGYLNDHADQYPQPSHDNNIPASGPYSANQAQGRAVWFNALDYYLHGTTQGYADGNTSAREYKSFKQDPVWEDLPEDAPGSTLDQLNVRTYKMNAFFGDIDNTLPNNPSDWRFFNAAEIRRTSKTVLIGDGRAHDTPSATSGNIDTGGAGRFDFAEIYVGLRHQGGANILFADTHAAYHRDAVRQTGSGYQGWYAGDAETNGYTGGGSGEGPQALIWRFNRGVYRDGS